MFVFVFCIFIYQVSSAGIIGRDRQGAVKRVLTSYSLQGFTISIAPSSSSSSSSPSSLVYFPNLVFSFYIKRTILYYLYVYCMYYVSCSVFLYSFSDSLSIDEFLFFLGFLSIWALGIGHLTQILTVRDRVLWRSFHWISGTSKSLYILHSTYITCYTLHTRHHSFRIHRRK